MTIHRYWGLVPLFTALYTTLYYVARGEPGEILWVCNVCSYLLGIGLLVRQHTLVWIATLWLIVGTPLWIMDNIVRQEFFTPHAFMMHIIGSLIGLLALRRSEKGGCQWWLALLLGIALNILARWLAAPELNVNLSASIYPAASPYFDNYPVYLLFNVIAFAISLYLLETVLKHIFARATTRHEY